MRFELSFERSTGALLLGSDVRLGVAESRTQAANSLASLIHRIRDLKNDYVWIDLRGLSFGGQTCAASFCFMSDRLHGASWSVSLPGAELEGGWPTRKAIDEEIAFVRRTLKQQLGRDFEQGREIFPWGTVFSVFDEKGFQAHNGLRHHVGYLGAKVLLDNI